MTTYIASIGDNYHLIEQRPGAYKVITLRALAKLDEASKVRYYNQFPHQAVGGQFDLIVEDVVKANPRATTPAALRAILGEATIQEVTDSLARIGRRS